MDIYERFWSKVLKTDTCWLWQGALTSNGYGRFSINGRYVYAHRFVISANKFPPTAVVDHLCRVRNCVNPEHLQVVTIAINNQRGDHSNIGRVNRAKTHCPRNHPYDKVNKKGWRICSICQRDDTRRRRSGQHGRIFDDSLRTK